MYRLPEADYALTEFAMDPSARFRVNPDDRLNVTFSMIAEPDQDETDKQGRPIFREEIYVTIVVPGERDVVVRKAWQKDYDRFPRQYAAFKNNQSQQGIVGTPLKFVPWLSQAQVKELEFFNCFSVEQLAELPDTHAHKFQQIHKLRQLARDMLQAAREAAPLTAMRAELDKRDNEIDTMKRQIEELSKALIEKSEKAAKK